MANDSDELWVLLTPLSPTPDPSEASSPSLLGESSCLVFRRYDRKRGASAEYRRNLIHASDSHEAATKEIGLWFAEAELSEYEPTAWVSVVICLVFCVGADIRDGSWPIIRHLDQYRMHQDRKVLPQARLRFGESVLSDGLRASISIPDRIVTLF
jgi:hypothetical protein